MSRDVYLLQRVRDEAHRFAVTDHVQRHSETMAAATLDAVSGLGPVRRAALLAQFGSVARVRAATVEQTVTVPGIGSRIASAITAALTQAHTRGSIEPHAGANRQAAHGP